MGIRYNPELPEGMEDLGPSEGIAQNHPHLLNASGQPVSSGNTSSLKSPPIEWVKDEELTKNNKKPFYYPKLEIDGIATEYGASRNHKMFYKGEREMFIQVFAMHISKYLFNVECVRIAETDDSSYFEVNPDFENLPVYDK